jgi:hypothetical protein
MAACSAAVCYEQLLSCITLTLTLTSSTFPTSTSRKASSAFDCTSSPEDSPDEDPDCPPVLLCCVCGALEREDRIGGVRR